MIEFIRKSVITKTVAVYLVISLMAELISPRVVFALTGGPSQPEVQSFSPIGTSEMVDPFSGDFSYNIPLLDVGGYPINLAYSSGIGMDQEASWVGLGWNINAGVINREMRGIPDDFKEEGITKEFNMKPNRTYKVFGSVAGELFGVDGSNISGTFSAGVGISYNNYYGFSTEQMFSVGIGLSAGKEGKGELTGNLGVTSGSDEGLTFNPKISFTSRIARNGKPEDPGTKSINGGIGVGTSFNSKSGLKGLTMNLAVSATKYNAKTVEERDRSRVSGSGPSSTISFGAQTYTPQVTMPIKNTSVTLSVKVGGTIFGGDGSYNVGGAFSEQRLDEKSQVTPSYGFLYSNSGKDRDHALMDFNREKDGVFTRNTPHLPLTNFTYDIFSVSGQGVGGSFRPFRSDLGYVFDSRGIVTSDSYSLGVEIDAGNATHVGTDVAITDVNSTSGKWMDDNKALDNLLFTSVKNNELQEPVYFKQVGEKSVDDEALFFSSTGGSSPVRLALKDAGGLVVRATNNLLSDYNDESSGGNPLPVTNFRTKRVKRNQVFSYLTKTQAINYGLQKTLYNNPNPQLSSEAKDHHIAEVTVLKPDGIRYVYGLPLYNTKQKEVTFNSSGRKDDASCLTGIVKYNATDNTTGNSLGLDNYFNSVTTPGYAHSYLLTAIISPDYVDVDDNGPSDNDLGTYTKFTYGSSISYNWRIPYGNKDNMQANFSEGLKTDPEDDKGSYVYGEKELKYLEKIETKNYVALFETAERADALGVADEDGIKGLSSCSGVSHMKLLKKISLYSKPDYNANSGNLANATPIKEVHFEYDYSLCPSVPNNERNFNINNNSCSYGTDATDDSNFPNQGGKLTLKKIFFTYGKSLKGKFSPYQFVYNYVDNNYNPNPNPYNPSYNLKGYDRWGNYKPNTGGCTLDAALPNAEFPYVEQGVKITSGNPLYLPSDPDQERTTPDAYAASWSLTKIILPSGGNININYESDDYAYVQDKRAMQMFKIAGVEQTSDANPSSHTIPTAPVQNLMNGIATVNDHIFIYFQLQEPYSSFQNVDTLKKQYFNNQEDVMKLYFRFLVNLTSSGSFCSHVPGGNSGQDYEYISGYADILKVGLMGASAPYTYGYIELKPVNQGDKDENLSLIQVHPICKAAWQFGRIYRSALLNCQEPISESGGIKNAIMSIINSNFYKNLSETVVGPNNTLNIKGFGKQVKPNKSWVRLFNPDKKKKGGGVRVKKLTISDQWGDMVSDASKTFQYGQEYDYTMTEGTNTISSGVAQYEPILGGDENPWKQPIPFENNVEDKLLIPDDEHYMEGPLGESFFPAPTVGYRQVTVKNLQRSSVVKRNATGKVVHEFYTAYDFPVISRTTTPKVMPKKKNPLLALFTFKTKDYLTASEGFSIELNDMHGKPKGQKVYAEDKDEPISSVEYRYKQQGFQRLNNEVTVINKDGTTASKDVGLEVDFVADFREQETKIETIGLNGNLASFLAAIIPGLVPSILPSYQSEETRFRSAVITKVIRRYGILNEVIATDVGSVVSTENLAWDAETGEVLVTKTINGFNDPVYSLTYPAHWAYKGMGPAYSNVGADISISFTNGFASSVPDALNRFSEGDEISIGTTTRAWIVEVTSNSLLAVTSTGAVFSGTATKVLRSGRRNRQNTPVGTLTLRTNPLNVLQSGNFSDVLNASSVEFSDNWGMFCGHTQTTPGGCVCQNTSQFGELPFFFNALTSHNDLLGCHLPLFNSGSGYSYPEYNNSSLNNTGLTNNYYTANTLFQKTLDMYPNLADIVYAIRKTSDRGYIMIGDINNEIPVLVKIDCNGKQVWSKAYSQSGEPVLRSVAEVKDANGNAEGYITVGLKGDKILVIKTNLQGDEVWSKKIKVYNNVANSISARGFHIIQLEDQNGDPDGFAVSGTVSGSFVNNNGTFLAKISSDGSTVLWSKLFADAGHGFTVKAIDDDDPDIFKDDGFIIAGTRVVNTEISSFLLRTGSDGTFMWEKNFNGTDFFTQSNVEDVEPIVDEVVQQTGDGGFIVTGGRAPLNSISGSIPFEPLIIKTNIDGDISWAKSYPVGVFGIGTSVRELPTGGFIITGVMSDNSSNTNTSSFLLRTNSSGTLSWAKEFDNSFGVSVEVGGQGYFLFAGLEGASIPFENTNVNLVNSYFAKTNDNGNTGCENTLSAGENNINVISVEPTVTDAVHFTDVIAINFTSASANNTITDRCCKNTLLSMQIDQGGTPCTIPLSFPNGTELCMSDISGFSNFQVVPSGTFGNCTSTTGSFTVDATVTVPEQEPITITMTGSTDCWDMGNNCTDNPAVTTQCGYINGDIINPYVQGMRGNWRAKKSYLYLTGRTQSNTNENKNIRSDGVFSAFSPFWMPNSGSDWTKNITNWTFTSEVTQFSPFGFEVENRDALGRYSAALYGYNNALPVAVASNSKYRHIASDGFEDYGFINSGNCQRQHFNYYALQQNGVPSSFQRTKQEAHTGLYSLRVSPGLTASVKRELTSDPCTAAGNYFQNEYHLGDCDCIGLFSPQAFAANNETYVLSVWAKAQFFGQITYAGILPQVKLNGNLLQQTLTKGEVIDNWQRMEVVFIVPSGASGEIEVDLKNNYVNSNAYFDDIRIHPFRSNMKTFVYHPVNLRLMAELDENNHATMYEYNEEGALIRVKKETERGIQTIQESRNSTFKVNVTQ